MKKDGESTNLDVVRYRFARDGSLDIRLLGPTSGRSQRLRIGPGTQLSLLSQANDVWQEVEVRAGLSPIRRQPLATMNTAQHDAGGIMANYYARNDHGRSVEASGVFIGTTCDRWRRLDVRSKLRVEIEGRGSDVLRTVSGVDGLVRLRSEVVPSGNTVMSASGGSSGTAIKTEIFRDADGNETGKKVVWENAEGKGSYSSQSGPGGRYEESRHEMKNGGSSSTQQWSDGRSGWSVHQEKEIVGGQSHTHTVETNSGPGGTTTVTTDEWRGKEKNSITGEENDTYHREETKTDASGKTETDRWSAVGDSAGNQSSTHVQVGGDGHVTITIRTVDGAGNGQEHIIETDASGKVIKDKTIKIGKSGTGSSQDDEDSGDGGDGDNDNDGEDGDDEGDDDGDDGSDDGGDDGVDDGGDDGDMDWDGTDEGRPKLPRLSGALAFDFGIPPGATPEDMQAWAEAYIAAVKAFIATGPEPGELPQIVPGRGPIGPDDGPTPGGATGEGDWGQEGFPEIKLEAGDWNTLTIGGYRGPTEDWGEWTDPRVLIAHAQRLAYAVAAEPHASGRGVVRAIKGLAGLKVGVERVGLHK